MSSTNKTKNLGLNSWINSDFPERADFVSDNVAIDKAISDHTKNNVIHINSEERSAWNSPYFRFSWIGDGTNTKTYDTKCPFDPSFGFVFASGYTPSVVDVKNNSNYNYFSIFTSSGNTPGCMLVNGNQIKVWQSSTAIQETEYRNFNQNGVLYIAFLFR